MPDQQRRANTIASLILDQTADAGEVHRLYRNSESRPYGGQAEAAGVWGRVYVVQGAVGSHHPRRGHHLVQILWPHACARWQRGPRLVHPQL